MIKAILTGHTRGLGAALAGELLDRKIPLLGLARRTDTGLPERFPGLIEQVALDLADSAALGNWLTGDRLAAFAAGADELLLINNAGVLAPMGALDRQDPAAVARAVCLNVAAPLMISSALAGLHRGGLRIVHISSGAARNAYPGWSVYCATKAALDHHARAVTLDGDARLRICSLAPGVIDTDMQAEIRETPVGIFPMQDRFVALKQDGQLASPRDVASRLVRYLLGKDFGAEPVADLRSLPEAG